MLGDTVDLTMEIVNRLVNVVRMKTVAFEVSNVLWSKYGFTHHRDDAPLKVFPSGSMCDYDLHVRSKPPFLPLVGFVVNTTAFLLP